MRSLHTLTIDRFKCTADELSMHCGAVYVEKKRHGLFNTLVEGQYYTERQACLGCDSLARFAEFHQKLDSIEHGTQHLKLRRLSITADMLKEWATGTGEGFPKFTQADLIMFLRAEFVDNDSYVD